MTNRRLVEIVKTQRPLVLTAADTVRAACRAMSGSGAGSVLVAGTGDGLAGIFTGRDAVRLLAKTGDAAQLPLAKAMTRKPVTVAPDDRALDALRAMIKGGFRHVPVVQRGRIWGVVSLGDLKGMELEEHHWRELCRLTGHDRDRSLGSMVARQRPAVLTGADTARDACRTMTRRKCGSVLVIDQRQRLAGIFTGRDAVRLLAKARDPAATPLSKAMTRKPSRAAPDWRAIDALRAMCDGGFRHLPVVGDDGQIAGVVSRGDFTGCEIDRVEQEQHLYECLW